MRELEVSEVLQDGCIRMTSILAKLSPIKGHFPEEERREAKDENNSHCCHATIPSLQPHSPREKGWQYCGLRHL
jgi:hypothetical protein